MQINYQNGIHPNSGKEFEVVNDIIITPFWTEEFCNSLIQIAEVHSTEFSKDTQFLESSKGVGLGWNDLSINTVVPTFLQDYTNHYKTDIIPILEKVFTKESAGIFGWFPPYIIKYTQVGQFASAHNDVSQYTLNVKLNSNYEGCDLTFSRQGFNSKDIPVGYAMIWPSTVTHPHYSTPLISGNKYSFVSWSWPPPWQATGIENI